MKNVILTFFSGVFFSVLLSAIVYSYWDHHQMTKIHTLEFPLLLKSEKQTNNFHFLPKGTTLYYDKSYPEGFTRYKVYINVDRMPLALENLNDPTLIIPLDGSAPEKDDLKKLLREHPISKDDLVSILQSGKIKKEEIKEVLEFFSKD